MTQAEAQDPPGGPAAAIADAAAPAPLAVLKALGDNTRYAIYLELARSPHPLATNDIAKSLALHPNTVRPHLERMREVGLLDVRIDARGGVGRPQHVYSLAADAPSLGLEPPAFPRLARMLVQMAVDAGLAADDALATGSEQGRLDAGTVAPALACLDALVVDLSTLGFDPAAVREPASATVGFMHCPFRDLAEISPAIVCGLHQGMVEGFVEARGGAQVREFRTLVHRSHPCQVDLADLDLAPAP